MVRHKLDSVSDFSRQGYNLRIRCLGCARVIDANAVLLSIELGKRKASRRIDDIEAKMRCRDCGHRGAHITPVPVEF